MNEYMNETYLQKEEASVFTQDSRCSTPLRLDGLSQSCLYSVDSTCIRPSLSKVELQRNFDTDNT